VYLDPSTKWPRKGKAVEHAQQKVKTGGSNRPPKGGQAADSGKTIGRQIRPFLPLGGGVLRKPWKSLDFGLCRGGGGRPYVRDIRI
jgi:hypothetical protein